MSSSLMVADITHLAALPFPFKSMRNQFFWWIDHYKSPIDILEIHTVRTGMRCETSQFFYLDKGYLVFEIHALPVFCSKSTIEAFTYHGQLRTILADNCLLVLHNNRSYHAQPYQIIGKHCLCVLKSTISVPVYLWI